MPRVLFYSTEIFLSFVFYICALQMIVSKSSITTAAGDRTVIKKMVKSITNHTLISIKIIETN